MKVICIDASDTVGKGTDILTKGRVYSTNGAMGGYYIIKCDDGVERTKLKTRFKRYYL